LLIAGRSYSEKGTVQKFLAEHKTIGGDLEEFGKIQLCSSTGAESRNKAG